MRSRIRHRNNSVRYYGGYGYSLLKVPVPNRCASRDKNNPGFEASRFEEDTGQEAEVLTTVEYDTQSAGHEQTRMRQSGLVLVIGNKQEHKTCHRSDTCCVVVCVCVCVCMCMCVCADSMLTSGSSRWHNRCHFLASLVANVA